MNKLLYLVFFIVLFYFIKPNISFKLNGNPREYGFGYDEMGYKKTVFTFYNIILGFVILTLFFEKIK